MCQTLEDGGKRCTKHTKPRYDALIEAMDTAATTTRGGPVEGRKQVRRTFRMDGENALNIVANHAAATSGTNAPNGAALIALDIKRYTGLKDPKTVSFLITNTKRGAERLVEAEAVAAQVKKDKEKEERARTGSRKPLKRNAKAIRTGVTMEAVHPGVAEWWDVVKNEGILPSEVAPEANGNIWLLCPQGHSWNGGRGNNITPAIKQGRRYHPICPECEGRRPRAFKANQQDLIRLVDALGGDATAFDLLSSALKYRIMRNMDLFSGGRDSVSRHINMSIVQSDLTLDEVMRAADHASIKGKVRENANDDTTDLATLSEADMKASRKHQIADEVDQNGPTTTLEQIFAVSGILTTTDETSELATSVLRETSEALWNHVLRSNTPIDLTGYAAHLRATEYGRDANRDRVLDMFLGEFEAVLALPTPSGYNPERVDAEGRTATLHPKLSQRRFAHLVVTRRRFMNLSGTGAGKTLAATLAVQIDGARETIVVCPNDVTGQWADEFRQGFPTTVEIRDDLFTLTEDPAPAPAGVNRVWVLNYEKFQKLGKSTHPRVEALAKRLDAIIFDEIHRAKFISDATKSQRRLALEKMTDLAGEHNPNLIVIGASATPVVNNLFEARSIIRLVEGPTSLPFPTNSTINDAARAYQRFSAVSIRHMPDYKTVLTRKYVKADLSEQIVEVFAHLKRCRAKSKQGQITPLAIEQAFLPAKILKVIESLKANPGPTVIYTHYTDGIVGPLAEALEAEGFRVGVHTGQLSEARRGVLADFRNGDLDVIIGSSTLGTGVDGLQRTSRHMIVLSMPWTAAADDQMVGRLQRFGQDHDVTITYIISEAKIGTTRWSYCENTRLRRVRHKRDLANAAVDGVVPDGSFDSQQKSVDRAFAQIAKLVEQLADTDVPAALVAA